MRNLLTVFAALAFAVGAMGSDQSPTHVKPTGNGIGGNFEVLPVIHQLNPGDEIYNTLSIGDGRTYSAGNGDTLGGNCPFGSTQDLLVADDVQFESDCCLGDVTRDYVALGSAFGCVTCPVDGAYIDALSVNGCDLPSSCPSGRGCTVAAVDCSTGSDPVFGLTFVRLTAHADGSCCGTAGTNYIVTQAVTDADWLYSVADLNQSIGCFRIAQDGDRGAPGYGVPCPSWMTLNDIGFGEGTVSMAVSVKCGPPTPRCVYNVSKVKAKADICGRPCLTCPYSRGDAICTIECASNDDCADRLRGFSACPEGGACKVSADLVGCMEPPRGCKRCP
jgi:hypothetical protein